MHTSIRRPYTFIAKMVAAAALIALADLFFYDLGPAATRGAFGIAWIAALALVRPDVRRYLPARVALAIALLFGLILIDDPSLLGWCLFWLAIASAALLPRRRFTDAISWTGRLIGHAILGLAAPVRDLRRSAATRRQPGRKSLGALMAILALPVIGGGLFLLLFASANPLISNAFGSIRLPYASSVTGHLVLWTGTLLAIWPSFRPRRTVPSGAHGPAWRMTIVPDVPLATLTLSLFTFNAIFAIQNGLDIAFLWSGAELPTGVTMTEYVHRGAYSLIVTALLAGVFVLVASRPNSAGAHSRVVRRLLTVWIGQNVLLVASSMLRLLNYIDAFSLTRLRIAALAWMVLVAVGLVLIAWRMLAGRSARWLINANGVAAALVLALCSVVDLGATAAAWNVRHAGKASELDLCYLRHLGASSLLPLIELERRAQGPRLRDQAVFLRSRIMTQMERDQADWRSWTWRNSRRLATARQLLGPSPRQPRAVPHGRDCAGALNPPPRIDTAPPAPAPAPVPLTKGAKP